MKKLKHEDLPPQSPLADKEKQHDWLHSVSASSKVSAANPPVRGVVREEDNDPRCTTGDVMSCQAFLDKGVVL